MKKIVLLFCMGFSMVLRAQQNEARFLGQPMDPVMAVNEREGQAMLSFENEDNTPHLLVTSQNPDYLNIGYVLTNGRCSPVEYYFSTKNTRQVQRMIDSKSKKTGASSCLGNEEMIKITQSSKSNTLSYLQLISKI